MYRSARLASGASPIRRFFVEIQENVRGEDVFVVQSTSFPANDHLMELLIMIDAFRRASAGASRRCCPISAMPGRTANPGRTPISAKLVANLITEAGADRVLTWTCTPARSRASSTFRPTTSSPPRCWPAM
jgi:ribose-phosphate pyrophosphokinase